MCGCGVENVCRREKADSDATRNFLGFFFHVDVCWGRGEVVSGRFSGMWAGVWAGVFAGVLLSC